MDDKFMSFGIIIIVINWFISLYLLALENRRRLERVEAVQDYAYHMYIRTESSMYLSVVPYGYHASGL